MMKLGAFRRKDIVGRKFGKLTILRRVESKLRPDKKGYIQMIEVGCECGNKKIIQTTNVTHGKTLSCGCLRKDPAYFNSKYAKGSTGLNRLYASYRVGSINRLLPFDLTLNQFKDITGQACHYCGSPPKHLASTGNAHSNYIYNGIDRVNNSEGYTIDNCLPCCIFCNKAKFTKSYAEFLEWVENLADNVMKKRLAKKAA